VARSQHGGGGREVADAHGIERLLELHRGRASIDTIAAALDAEGFRTPAGRRWRPQRVARVISERIRRSAGTPGDRPDTARSVWPVGSVSRPAVRFSSAAGQDVGPPDETDDGGLSVPPRRRTADGRSGPIRGR
jgi:hypothetical protein